MEKWQSGDIQAFEDLFRRYEKMVFRNAYLITGNRQDAEDVLQGVFVSVWKSRHTFDPARGSLGTWLHRITVNECMRARRGQRPLLLPEGKDVPDFRPGPEKSTEEQLEHEGLISALNSLDGRHRAVLVLRYFNDLSYDEIAGAVGVPLGTVKSRINHALKKLRRRLGGQRTEEQ